MIQGRVVVIDDEENICRSCAEVLREDGLHVKTFTKASEGLRYLRDENADLVLLDLKMADVDGLEVLKEIKEAYPETLVVIITGYATVETAVSSMKLGAFDYVPKPFTPDELSTAVQRALAHKKLIEENKYLREELVRTSHFDNIIGESHVMKQVGELINRVAPTDATVLIHGESGTGKELVARAIHYNSQRKEKSFVVVDCASLAQSVIESELFGYVKGAFTGAAEAKQGLLEIADEGTLFLDEIANINLDVQAKLLRVLQEREYKRVGDSRSRKINIRFIAATNRNLETLMKERLFREDLFYRLDVFRIYMPPLRERAEDISLLADYFLVTFARNMHKNIEGFSPEAMNLLKEHNWPGNVRELKNTIERLVILMDESVAHSSEVIYAIGDRTGSVKAPIPRTAEELKTVRRKLTQRIVDDVEKAFILEALKRSNWNVSKAAEDVGLLRPNFHALMRKHRIVHGS